MFSVFQTLRHSEITIFPNYNDVVVKIDFE